MNSSEYWLSIDLSSRIGTLALLSKDSSGLVKSVFSNKFTESGDHSETFIPKLEFLLNQHQMRVKDISRYITCSGPGSFTGLRIALATLKALAYPYQTPIDTVSGSEVRGLSWISKNPLTHSNSIYVVTLITADKFVLGEFKRGSNSSFEFLGDKTLNDWSFLKNAPPSTLILDEKTNPNLIPQHPHISVANEPLHAETLGRFLPLSQSRTSYSSIEEWVQISPEYFGTSKF